jgi:chemotaxis signal transduction protein
MQVNVMNEPVHELLVFELASEPFGVPVARVREVVRLGSLTRLPGAPANILGLASVRGRILTTYDLGRTLALPNPTEVDQNPVTGRKRLLLVDVEAEEVALVVDRILGVEKVPHQAVEPIGLSVLMRGVYTRFGRTCVVLDLNGIAKFELGKNEPALLGSAQAMALNAESKRVPDAH